MGIKRFVANKDTTITNAYKGSLTTTGEAANMGAADILEVFTIYAQANTASREEARALLDFPVSDISAARAAGDIPASGSVSFYLRMFNAEHELTLPTDYTMQIAPVTKSWDEGYGLDMDNYTDPGYPSGIGATWAYAASGSTWAAAGGDIEATTHNFTASVGADGTDDVEVDVTPLVEAWLDSSLANNGLAVRFPPATSSLNRSYYTKRYFGRGSEFFFKRPLIEARWGTANKDNAGNFYASSSLVADNSNKLYFYNLYKGQKQNVPSIGTGNVTLDLYATLGGTSLAGATGSWVSTGIYSASITLDNTASSVYPVWGKPGSSAGGTAATNSVEVNQGNVPQQPDWDNHTLTLVPYTGPPVIFTFNHLALPGSAPGYTEIGVLGLLDAASAAETIAEYVNDHGIAITATVGAPGVPTVITFTQEAAGTVGNTTGNSLAVPSVILSGLNASFSGGTDEISTPAVQLLTCSVVTVNSHAASCYNPNQTYVSNVTNLKSIYSTDETARFRVYARQKDWSPTIYTVASANVETSIVEDAYFKVVRSVDDYEVIGFGTGSIQYTLMSYDSKGNYFDLDMSMFQKDYAYEIVLAYRVNDKIVEQKETFKFRVE